MQVQDASMMLLRIMVRAPLMLIGGLIMGLITSPRLSLLFIPLMPAVGATMLTKLEAVATRARLSRPMNYC